VKREKKPRLDDFTLHPSLFTLRFASLLTIS
jgi:hypothetical protein